MGEVKDTVKGSGGTKKTTKKRPEKMNLIDQVEEIRAEVSRLTTIKDDETLSEGDSLRADNLRKAGVLRATYSLLTAAKALLEGY